MSGADLHVVLTGGAGFVGGPVLQALLRLPQVAHVHIATRRAWPAPLPARCTPWALDLADGPITLPDRVDVVLHVAGEKREPARMQAVNHHGTRRLAEAAAARGAGRFVHLSSVGVYGVAPHAGRVGPDHARTPRNAYEVSKNDGELAVREVAGRAGMPLAVLQPTNVIGRSAGGGNPLLGLMRIVARRQFRWFGEGEPWVNYVAVEDVAAALALACVHPQPFGCHIVNTPARLQDLVGWTAGELGVPAPRGRWPAWAGRCLAGAAAAVQAATGRHLPFGPERLLEMTNTTVYLPDSFTAQTGFSPPIGIEATVRGLARAYRAEGLV